MAHANGGWLRDTPSPVDRAFHGVDQTLQELSTERHMRVSSTKPRFRPEASNRLDTRGRTRRGEDLESHDFAASWPRPYYETLEHPLG
ncbi:hypothetical protein D187_007217 [Cystobacter fuscus DSM 2262]|uniref:Uncharacterized protein n=1 Tax=Cystobacter fuscus (strain ATCC 25194 / DSM 2262 / NBRC 100088 / M29) TaxID=1242864 RepID=S9QJX8_CYSF2|nr:hypothetical protein D187_007217 [Cystobacter fuscus DSM 2262]